MAQRPESLVREAVVVARLLLGRQPDAAKLIRRLLRRHRHAGVLVRHLAIGGAAPVRDPGARAGAHDRLHGGHQPARGPPQREDLAAPHVDVRLAVGDDHHLVPRQVGAEDGAERVGRPGELVLVTRAVIRLEVSDQGAQVAGDGPQLRELAYIASVGRAQQPLAPQQGAQALHPAAPAQLGDGDGDERDRRTQAHEEHVQVLARLRAAARDEAHVVDDDEVSDRHSRGFQRPHRDEQRACGAVQQMPRGARKPFQVRAPDLGGQRRRDHRLARRGGAIPHREQALILGDPIEECEHPGPLARLDQILERLLRGSGDQAGAAIQVPHEPLERELVHERHRRVREGAEREEQGQHEPQGKSHAGLGKIKGEARTGRLPLWRGRSVPRWYGDCRAPKYPCTEPPS